eukprot:6453679-Amphidinium_carterae.1
MPPAQAEHHKTRRAPQQSGAAAAPQHTNPPHAFQRLLSRTMWFTQLVFDQHAYAGELYTLASCSLSTHPRVWAHFGCGGAQIQALLLARVLVEVGCLRPSAD